MPDSANNDEASTTNHSGMTLPFLESASFWASVSVVIFTVLAAIAGVFAWYFSSRLSEKKDADLDRFKTSSAAVIASAEARAAEANSLAKSADAQAAASKVMSDTLTKENLLLQADVLKLRQAAAPRGLTESQKSELIAKLSATPPFKVSFTSPVNGGKELFDFRDDLIDVFVRMKLIPPGGPPSGKGIINMEPFTGKGVIVGIKGVHEFPPAANVLLLTLHDWGFEVSSEPIPNRIADSREILIGVFPKQ